MPGHRWTELVSRTISDALNDELKRRGCSMKEAAKEMNTTVQNVVGGLIPCLLSSQMVTRSTPSWTFSAWMSVPWVHC